MATNFTFEDEDQGIFQSWKIREGAVVPVTTILLIYKDTNGELKQAKATESGIVQSMAKLKEGDRLVRGQILFQLRPCDHPVVMKDLCADCGEDLRQKFGLPGERVVQTHARVAMIHHIPELQITPEEAKNYGTADEQNLLRQRKLVLLVDLDQTLIHTTNEDVNPRLKDVFHFQLYGSTSPWYHTRLRPHTRHFLETISKLYELHICTFGARLYAHTVAKILDPEQKLFGHRILSREECFDANLKIANLKALFPCGDRLVSIIDDREDVWNYAPNVVHVKPYRYFKHTGDINAPPGFTKNGQTKEKSESSDRIRTYVSSIKEEPKNAESIAEAEIDEQLKERKMEITSDETSSGIGTDSAEQENRRLSTTESMSSEDDGGTGGGFETDQDDDDYLYHLEDILKRIHTAFYQMHDQMKMDERPPDLKSVVPYVKNKVLKRCNIVFSGVVPTNVAIESSPIYKAAVQFGANVQKDVIMNHHNHNKSHSHSHHHKKSTNTTHLVAAKWGTAKVYQARKIGSNIKIVTPQWLWCCVERWEREDERLFLLSKSDEIIETNQQQSTKRKNDIDIDDDQQEQTGSDNYAEIIDDDDDGTGPSTSMGLGDDEEISQITDSILPKDGREDEESGDYEPEQKKWKGAMEGDESSISSSSTSSSSNTKSKTEEESDQEGDEEMANALEKELE